MCFKLFFFQVCQVAGAGWLQGRAHVTSRMDGATQGLRYSQGVHLSCAALSPLEWSASPTPAIDWSSTKTSPPVDWPSSPSDWSSPARSSEEEDWASTPLDWTPPQPTKDQDLFDLLNRLQGSRLNDQRCIMPGGNAAAWTPSRHRLESILRGSPPHPMVALPPEGGFWCDPSDQHKHDNSFDSEGNPVISDSAVGELDESPCRTYRAHFLQSEHFNFCGLDDVMGPVVLSVKYYCDSDNTSNHIRIVLRLTSGTTHRLVARQQVQPSPIALARMVCPEISLTTLQPVLCPKASELLLNYDEHVLVNNFKFQVIYQKVHQTSDEALFGNSVHSHAMDKLLDMISIIFALYEHIGYRG